MCVWLFGSSLVALGAEGLPLPLCSVSSQRLSAFQLLQQDGLGEGLSGLTLPMGRISRQVESKCFPMVCGRRRRKLYPWTSMLLCSSGNHCVFQYFNKRKEMRFSWDFSKGMVAWSQQEEWADRRGKFRVHIFLILLWKEYLTCDLSS